MVIIDSSIDKTLIPDMPQVEFPGVVTVVDDIGTAAEAIRYLHSLKIVGFDTETKPSFKKGLSYKTALLQLASADRAFLFRLNRIGLPDFVCDFLCDPGVMKIGLSVKDDFASLRRHCASLQPEGFLELQNFAAEFGIREKGLQRLYALLFGKRISKRQQLSNWESDALCEAQCQYAAIDAWACLEIYNYLAGLRNSGDYQINIIDAEESVAEKGQGGVS